MTEERGGSPVQDGDPPGGNATTPCGDCRSVAAPAPVELTAYERAMEVAAFERDQAEALWAAAREAAFLKRFVAALGGDPSCVACGLADEPGLPAGSTWSGGRLCEPCAVDADGARVVPARPPAPDPRRALRRLGARDRARLAHTLRALAPAAGSADELVDVALERLAGAVRAAVRIGDWAAYWRARPLLDVLTADDAAAVDVAAELLERRGADPVAIARAWVAGRRARAVETEAA